MTRINLVTKEKQTQTQRAGMGLGRERLGFGVDTCTLLCLKWRASKDLLSSAGKVALHSAMT